MRPDRVDEQHLPERRARPGPPLEVERRGHVHERERHELGEAAGLGLQGPGPHQMAGDVDRRFDVAEHDGDVRAQTDLVGAAVRVEPLVGRDLVGADDGAHLVVEDLRRGAGQRREPGLVEGGEVVGQRHAEAAGALGHLERGERVEVEVGGDLLHRPGHVEVVVAVEVGVDPALEADLGGAVVDGLEDPPLDLVTVQEVRVATQVQGERALREGAEPAAERADVRVVDVAVPHEGDDVTDRVASQLVGDVGDQAHVGAPRREQRDDLVDVGGLAGQDPVEDLADRAARRPGRRRRAEHVGRRRVAPRRPVVVPGQTLGVGGVQDRGAYPLVEPALGVERVLGVHGEARSQRLAGGLGRGARAARGRATGAPG